MPDSLVLSIQQKFQSWFTRAQAKAKETDNDLTDLPENIADQIERQLQKLTSPKAYQSTIQEAIATGVADWQQRLSASNSLVILGSPVEPIADIMHESLHDWQDAPLHLIVPLDCRTRPTDPLMMTQRFRQALEPYPVSLEQEEGDRPEVDQLGDQLGEQLGDRLTLLVIPSLDQCFLRCIGGWDGIEYLRDLSIRNRNCFWVVGCSHWAWNYLDFVCQISAYFSEVTPLPDLEGDMLQDWLDPIAKTVIEIEHSEEDEGDRQPYWKNLASQSSRVSSIAVQLWLQSLHIQKDDLEAAQDLTDEKLTEGKLPFKLHETPPVLPSLPSLNVIDRYILHSLLIHNYATHAHLALSLGEPESQIQSRVQRLLRERVLELRQGKLSVRAIYYAKLKTELANNNFFVGED
ncbi:MAG: hypothetical protein WBA57_27130 [Elainellaceae cyanobacterium]